MTDRHRRRRHFSFLIPYRACRSLLSSHIFLSRVLVWKMLQFFGESGFETYPDPELRFLLMFLNISILIMIWTSLVFPLVLLHLENLENLEKQSRFFFPFDFFSASLEDLFQKLFKNQSKYQIIIWNTNLFTYQNKITNLEFFHRFSAPLDLSNLLMLIEKMMYHHLQSDFNGGNDISKPRE